MSALDQDTPSITLVNPYKPRLLIVDDEDDNIELLTYLFEPDCHVDSCYSGPQALQHIQEHEYDAVLLDIMMPIMNGFDVLHTVRRKKDILELPIILLSAMQGTDDIVNGMRSGANDYITKPFNVDIVVARVQTQMALRRMMVERRDATENLRSANALTERMMQIASHDLKNPLNNLRLMTAIMQRQLERNNYEQLTAMINLMDESFQTMLGVVENFLDLPNGTQESDLVPQLEPIDVGNVVDRIIQEYQVAAAQKALHIGVDVQGIVQADMTRITQVISNLLSNAIKYSPLQASILISSEQMHHVWRLNVRDYGPGIPVTERHKLFKPFSQISNEPTGGEASTGLGLWIVAEMMRLQGGRAGVNHLDDGSCFWIELPMAVHGAQSKI